MFFSSESYGLSTAAGRVPYVPIRFYDADDSCPFAAKAWLTLIEKGLNFERIGIDLKNKPQEFTYLYSSLNPDPSAKAKVPLIIDGNNKVVESNLVAEYLDNAYPDSGPKLFPYDPLQQFKVRWFAEMFSQQISSNMYTLLGANSEAAAEEAKAELDQGLRVLNHFIEQHGTWQGSDFFLGDYTFAEVVSTPFLQRGIIALKELRGYSIRTAIQQQKLIRLGKWLEAVLSRPSNDKIKPADDAIAHSYKELLGDYAGHIDQSMLTGPSASLIERARSVKI